MSQAQAGANAHIAHAMVLAAGRGERMRPLTDTCPKPLIEVRGQPIIDYVLDCLAAAEVTTAVVNLHYLGSQLEAHLSRRDRPPVTFSHEDKLLNTGGGVFKALPHLGGGAFFVVNGDVVWLDGRDPALKRMSAHWDEARMDALLLLHPTAFSVGYHGRGDFIMDPEGRLRRRRDNEVSPFVFTGIQILHARLFDDMTAAPFSLNKVYDKAAQSGRLWGLRHDGEWCHVGTPEALKQVEAALHHLSFYSVQR